MAPNGDEGYLIAMTETAHPSEAGFGGANPPSRPLTLRANFQWTFVGNVVNSLGQWGILLLLAKLADERSVGMFSIGLAISTPIMAFTMLQLRSVQATDVRGEFPFSDYFGTRIVWTILAMGLIVVWAIAGGYETEAYWVVVVIGMAKAFDSLSDIVRGVFQRHERMDYSGISLCIRGITGFAGFAVVFLATRDILWASGGMAVAYLVSFLLYDLIWAKRILSSVYGRDESGRDHGALEQPTAARTSNDGTERLKNSSSDYHRLSPRFRGSFMIRLSWIALPLGVVMGLITFQTNIPRLVLEHFAGLETLAYFAVMVYPIQAGQMVIGALGQSAAPRLANYYLDNRPAYRALLRKLLLLAGGLGAALVGGVAAFGGPILAILYRPEYAEFHLEFVVLAVAAAIQLVSSCWGYGLTSARRFRTQVTLVSVSCAATAAAAFVLVPRWGVMGASLTVLVTSIVMWLLLFLAIRAAVRAPRPLESGPGR